MQHPIPTGFRLAGVHCGIKRKATNEDLALVVCDAPAVAAGVYTKNIVRAAPVILDEQRTPTDQFHVLVINSGNANACTGDQGMRDAEQMTQLAADACRAAHDAALVLSTGVIGVLMPMEKVQQGIAAAAAQLSNDEASLIAAARGIMTTDTCRKIASRQIETSTGKVSICGIAKGSGMIGPNMATMLAVIMTDAKLGANDAQAMLTEVTDDSFNSISVDGHTSTNDTALLLASGQVGTAPLAGAELASFKNALLEVCVELARMIADDGEGATHLITIRVNGCATLADARRIAQSVANSPLVKTAIAGNDPNWGRIVSAAGYSGVDFAAEGVSLHVNGFLLYEQGTPAEFDDPKVSASIAASRETDVELTFSEGSAGCRFWTCDLTTEYVHINADYRT
ncbi:MAG: bifunctional glutamate N-acetyltransferase/amino-acid acetyltransferase ArgJ [Planctomycetales bacterium]|nr:bifunctional glutamate N-acetyltransferase/amino-acid acetyltransferase ArgJ [Planctomycetales bacterium]